MVAFIIKKLDSHSSIPIELPNNVLSAYQKFVEETRQASGWIVDDDKCDFVWFCWEQFPSSAADIVKKTNTTRKPKHKKQDNDYDDIDNNGSSDIMINYEDASVFVTLFAE
ncbi:hypothetical protein TNCV_3907391 [Trichonephila clavipes]|nr:hypothetical protein TNCV_3907391 [Trichonephila clavipes]